MENEIKKLIEKWNRQFQECEIVSISPRIMFEFVEDLQSLLKIKEKNCCGNFIIEEVTHKRIEAAAYNRGHHDGYMQAKNEEYE